MKGFWLVSDFSHGLSFSMLSQTKERSTKIVTYSKHLQRLINKKFAIRKAYKKMQYERNRLFEGFWKQLFRKREINSIFVHLRLSFACNKKTKYENVSLSAKFVYSLKKNNLNFSDSFWLIFWIFVVAIQKILVKQFLYMEIVWLALCYQKKFHLYYLWCTEFYAKTRKSSILNFDYTISAKLSKLIWKAFFYRICLWNYMISIFSLCRSTRVAFFLKIEFKLKHTEIITCTKLRT